MTVGIVNRDTDEYQKQKKSKIHGVKRKIILESDSVCEHVMNWKLQNFFSNLLHKHLNFILEFTIINNGYKKNASNF